MGRNFAKPLYETLPTKGSKLSPIPYSAVIQRLTANNPIHQGPLPWQKKAIRLIREIRPPTVEELDLFGDVVKAGVPRRRQIIVTIPRQSGKSLLSKGVITARAEYSKSLILATAQGRQEAFTHQQALAEMLGGDVHYTTNNGREVITWPNGSRYRIFTPDKKGAHGATIGGLGGLVLVDEAWSINSDTLQGPVPAMSTNPFAQILIISTAGDTSMVVWDGLRKAGRASIEDPDSAMGYLEYSCGDENVDDVFDPSKWGRWMPALGLTISRKQIEDDMELLKSDPTEGMNGVVRHYGNVTVATKVSIFPMEWVEKAWRVIESPDRFVLAVDVNKDPAGAALTTGHIVDGGIATQLYEWMPGTPNWVPEKVREILSKHKVDTVVADLGSGSPTKQVEPALRAACESAYVPLVDRKPGDLAADYARFYDGLREGTAFISLNSRGGKVESVASAIQGAVDKPLRDARLISRTQMSVDASPLISMVMAHGMAAELAAAPVVEWPPKIY